MDRDTIPGVIPQCEVCVHVWSCIRVCMCDSSLGFLSDHRECDKWMCQSLMEHCDCSARHKAITRLYRQAQRKILFQSTTHNLGNKDVQQLIERVGLKLLKVFNSHLCL